jgi:hypothetical protein
MPECPSRVRLRGPPAYQHALRFGGFRVFHSVLAWSPRWRLQGSHSVLACPRWRLKGVSHFNFAPPNARSRDGASAITSSSNLLEERALATLDFGNIQHITSIRTFLPPQAYLFSAFKQAVRVFPPNFQALHRLQNGCTNSGTATTQNRNSP